MLKNFFEAFSKSQVIQKEKDKIKKNMKNLQNDVESGDYAWKHSKYQLE